MKKVLALLLSFVFLFSFAACAKLPVTDTADRGQVTVYLDGKEVGKVSIDSFQKKTETKVIGDDTYYGKALAAIIDSADVSTVKAAFTKSADGFAQYFKDAADIFVAIYKVDGESYTSITNDSDKGSFTAVTASAKAKEVTDIYLLSDAQDWSVKVTIDGNESTLTIDDFMKMNPTYQTLSHKYNGGADTFEGEFLAVDSKTFLEAMGCELVEGINDDVDDDGNNLMVNYVPDRNLKITGMVQASGFKPSVELNTDLKASPFREKTAWLVYYFVLINGNDKHEMAGIEAMDLDFSCIYDGTGVRWMTTPITEIEMAPIPTTAD